MRLALFFSLFALLGPSKAFAAFPTPVCTWTTNEGADWVLGQADTNANFPNRGMAVDANTLNSPEALIIVGSKLIVADTQNSRVLIWNSLPSGFGVPADVVLGQADFLSNFPNNPSLSAASLNIPRGLASDGTRLFVSDSGNNRILVYNSIPTSSGASADIVLGQPDFSTVLVPPSPSNKKINNPRGLAYGGGKLILADYGAGRVVWWDGSALSDFAPVERVIAANILTGNFCSGSISDSCGYGPAGVATDGTRIAVVSQNDNRILLFNSFPAADFLPADIMIGQSDFSSGIPNFPSLGAASLNSPSSAFFTVEGGLQVSDSGNHRVLVFDSIPNTHAVAADRVLGQAGFTLSDPLASDRGLSGPAATAQAPGSPNKLYVADRGNSRVLVYDCLFFPTPTPTFTPTATDSPTPSPTQTLTPPALPFNESLDNYSLSFVSGSMTTNGTPTPTNKPWFWQVSETHDGIDALRSGAVGDDEESYVQTTLPAGILDFWWKVDAEQCCDFLEVRVAGSTYIELHNMLGPWTWQSVTLTAQSNVVDLVYRKDFAVTAPGEDAAWMDEMNFLAFTPTPTLTASPTFSATPTPSLSFTQSSTFTYSPTVTETSTWTPTPLPPDPKAGLVFSYPNPGVPGEVIQLVFEPDSSATIDIFNWSLDKVGEVPSNQIQAAAGRAVWDGRDRQGRNLAPGLYFMLVKTPSRVVKGRLSIMGRP